MVESRLVGKMITKREAGMGIEEWIHDFCEHEYDRLVGYLGLHCGDVTVAEEIAQEALARGVRDWDKIAPGARETWLYRVATNLLYSDYRPRRRERDALSRLTTQPTIGGDRDAASAIAIRAAVLRLPLRERTALTLRYFLDLSVVEVADFMECPVGTVKTLTRRAIASLRNESILKEDFID